MNSSKHTIINLIFRLLIFFLCLSITGIYVYGFSTPEPDRIYTIFNKTFYVTGETIWYKVYLLNKNSESRVIHIGIFNSACKLLIDQKLKVVDGAAIGSVEIPIEWPDDNYRFEVLTRWNLNFGILGIYEKIIPIYNSSLPSNYTSALNDFRDSKDLVDSLIQSSQALKFIFDKNSYTTRDSVELKIQSLSAENQYNLSVSVTDLSQIPVDINFHDTASAQLSLQTGITKSEAPLIFKPEKNLLFEGTVMSTDKSSIINSRVLSIYLPSQNLFIRAGTINGILQTDLPEISKEEVIQVLNMNPFEEHMPLINQVHIWDHITFSVLHNNTPIHTAQIDQFIYHTRLRRKLNEIFINKETYASHGDSNGNLFPHPDMNYDMAKFKLLNDLEDFIMSVVLEVRRIKEKGKSTMRMFNNQTKYYFMYHPWYRVDGLFSYDEPEILSTPFSSMTSVGFYTNYQSIYHFEPLMILNGIISITTNDHHWENEILAYPNTIHFKGFYAGKTFVESQPELISGNSEVPDLRPVVYWDPNIIIKPNKPAVIKFRSTDNTGLFLVEITGEDKNGSIIKALTGYKVLNPR